MTPSHIDRYEVRSEIGRGGMATVFLAYDPRFERDVAIKILPPQFLHDPQFRARFEREARTVAGLEHPAIVPVYDFGEDQGQPFLVMRYLEGGTLGQRLKDGPIGLADTARILAALAQGLDAAHRRGIIHRDLKPANILFDRWGEPYLSDFGIAKMVAGSSTVLTATGGLVGTPAYMSPEQVHGSTDLDGRSDIYALGAITFEMLTGHRPYQAETPMGLALKHVTEPVPRILEINHYLPPDCQNVIARAMAKEPEARYLTTAALAEDVARLAGGKTVPPPDQPDRSGETTLLDRPPTPVANRRLPGWVSVVGGLFGFVLLLAGIAAMAGLLLGQLNGSDAATDVAVQPTIDVSPTSPAATLITPTPLLSDPTQTGPAATSQPEIALTSTQPPPPPAPTMTPAGAPDPPTETPIPDSGRQPIPGDGLVQWTDGPDQAFVARLSPDQRTLAYMSDETGNWQINAMSTLDGRSTRLTNNNADNYHPSFSPDGRQLVFASKASGDWEIYTMRPDGSDLLRLTDRAGDDVYPSFSPDAQWIVYMSQRNQGWAVYRMRADGSNDQVVVDTANDDTFPVYSPDGRQIAYQSYQNGNHDIYLVDVAGGSAQRLTTDPARDATPYFSPDGRWIAFESNRNGDYEIFVVNVAGGELRNLTNHPAADQVPAFSPDGQWLIFQSDRDGPVQIFRQPFDY